MAMGQSGQIELSIATIQNIKIPLPPTDVQEKIVKEIEALEIIQNAIANKIEKLESLYSEKNLYLDNKKRKLQEVTLKIGSGATPLGGESVYQKEGISLIRSQNVYDGFFCG